MNTPLNTIQTYREDTGGVRRTVFARRYGDRAFPSASAVGPDRSPSPRAVRATPIATTAVRAGRAIPENEINHERVRQAADGQ